MPGRPRPPLARHPRPVAAKVARVVLAIGFGLFLLLLAGIVLTLFDADPGNAAVELVLDLAGWFGGPFEGLFDVDDEKTQVLADWGIAALAYAVGATVIAAVIDRAARGRS